MYKGKMVGRIGNAGSFSFYPGKNLGAYGDAGGMITDDDRLAEAARMLGQHGQSRTKHDHKIEGRNSRLDGIQAAILSVKLPHLHAWTEARRRHAELYRELLSDSGLKLQTELPETRHAYHLFVVQVEDRENVAHRLSEAGINTAIQYPHALPYLSAYRTKGHTVTDFPNAAFLTANCLSLPMFPELTGELIAHVARNLSGALGRK
jgi:dTDP-4-amino-4,6-dideoxygalactose transaminase